MIRYFLVGAVALILAGVAQAQPAPPEGPPPPRDEMHRGPHGGNGPMMMRRMMEGSKAARFRFERGEAQVDIKCAADEPMRACVDAAVILMDKLAAQPAK